MRTEGGRDVVRLWCAGNRRGELYDEIAVYAEPGPDMPKVGDKIWWQSGWIMFDRDRKKVRKIGNSFDPRNTNS